MKKMSNTKITSIKNSLETKQQHKKIRNGAFTMIFLTTLLNPGNSAPGPEKWPLIDLKYHAEGEKITGLCSRATQNGITPSTASNIKDPNHKYQYKFLWTAWVKLPVGMIMKRYDYDPNLQNTDESNEYSDLKYGSGRDTFFQYKNSHIFVLNDLTKFNEKTFLRTCYNFDETNPGVCNSAKACASNVVCRERCPRTQNIFSGVCNQDHTKRCKTVGTEAWFFIGADYSIMEPSGEETCKLEFSNLRASPTSSDSSYGTTDCSDFSDPLRLHEAFATNRGGPNSDITQDSGEIKLQLGYETIIVKKRASAFIVLDKNELYVTGRGNTGSDLEITLDDIRDYHFNLNFFIALLAGEPTPFKFFDFTRWNPLMMKDYLIAYKFGSAEMKKFLFENYSPYGFPIHPDMDLVPNSSPFTGGLEFYERLLELSGMPLIDFDNLKFCASFSSTLTVVRKATNTLASDGSNRIIFRIRFGFKQDGSHGGHTYANNLFVIIKRIDASHIKAYISQSDDDSIPGTEVNTSSGTDFKVDGQLKGDLSYPTNWSDQGFLEILAQFTLCPVDPEKENSQQYIPIIASLTVKDSESQIEKVSSKPIYSYIGQAPKQTFNSKLQTMGIRISVHDTLSVKNNLGFYVSNLGVYHGGYSPTMLDRVTTDTVTYPNYNFWKNHFLEKSPFAMIGGSRTKQDGTKDPNDSVYLVRCGTEDPKIFLSGDQKSCLIAEEIPGCLRYRADTDNPTKGVCERCEENSLYWLDKSNPGGVCKLKVENPGFEVNCDSSKQNHYKEGECHTCEGVEDGCICNSNQVAGDIVGTCKCQPDGCGVCHEAGGSQCQFCFPSGIFFEHPDDAGGTLQCVDRDKINVDHPGKGYDKTRLPPSLVACAAVPECLYCEEDASICTKCTGSDINNPTQYFASNGICILQTSIPARSGFTSPTTYSWKITPCSSLACSNCFENFDNCQTCDPQTYLFGSSSTTCIHENNIPEGYGKLESLKKLLPCTTENCSNCKEDYQICENCKENFLLDTSQNPFFCKKKCELNQYYQGRETNECEFCSDGCLNCEEITGKCIYNFTIVDFYLEQAQIWESIIEESEITLKLEPLFQNKKIPDYDIFNKKNNFQKKIFTVKISGAGGQEIDSYTTKNSEGRLEIKLNITKFLDEKIKKIELEASPLFWKNDTNFSYPSINESPMINLKNSTKKLKIYIEEKATESKIGAFLGSVDKFAEPFTVLIALFAGVLSLDPNGFMLKFSQFLSLIRTMIFIDIGFGKQSLEPFLESISGFDKEEFLDMKKKNKDKIWLTSKKYRGKFTKYSISLEIEDTILFHSGVYVLSSLIKYSLMLCLYYKINTKKMIGKRFIKVLRIQRRIHLAIFGVLSLKIWFQGTRIISHLEEHYLTKITILFIFILLILDFLQIMLDGINASKTILNSDIDQKKNGKKVKRKIVPAENKLFKNNNSRNGSKVISSSRKRFSHDPSFNNLDTPPKKQPRGSSKLEAFRRNRPLNSKKKYKKAKNESTLKLKPDLNKNFYIARLNIANVKLLLTELNQSDQRLLNSTGARFSNLWIFTRNVAYQILIPSLSSMPMFLLFLIAIVEFSYLMAIGYNYFKNFHIRRVIVFISKIAQSLFLMTWIVIMILIGMNQKNRYFSVNASLQSTGIVVITLAIAIEYFFILVIFVIFAIEEIMVCCGKKVKNSEEICFGFDFGKVYFMKIMQIEQKKKAVEKKQSKSNGKKETGKRKKKNEFWKNREIKKKRKRNSKMIMRDKIHIDRRRSGSRKKFWDVKEKMSKFGRMSRMLKD